MSEKHVLVTTSHRGVFFGILSEERDNGTTVVLIGCQNCITWGADVKGFLGLAATGPTESCRIGPDVPKSTIYSVTSITECTEEAVAAWRSMPWKE